MKKERIAQVLSDHKKYLQNLGGCCADLSYADLRGGDLRGADLRGANLRKADLIGADIDFSCLPIWCGIIEYKSP